MPQNIQDKPIVTTVNLNDQISLIRAGDLKLVNSQLTTLAAALGLINVVNFDITSFSLGASLFEIGVPQNRTATVVSNVALDTTSPTDTVLFTPTTATPFTTVATQSVTPNGTATHTLSGYSFGATSAGLDSGKAASFSGGRLIYNFGAFANSAKQKIVGLTSYNAGSDSATQQIVGLYPIFYGHAPFGQFQPSTIQSRASVLGFLNPILQNVTAGFTTSNLVLGANNDRRYFLVDDDYPPVSSIQIFFASSFLPTTSFNYIGTMQINMLDVARTYRIFESQTNIFSGTDTYRLVF